MAIKVILRLYTSGTPPAGMCTSLKSNIVMTHHQINNKQEQNTLEHALAQKCQKVSLHTILIGVMGTIFQCYTELQAQYSSESLA